MSKSNSKTQRNTRITALAVLTSNAYSADTYGPTQWRKVAAFLLDRGYSMDEAEQIMRSKWMRWAADAYATGERAGAACVEMWLNATFKGSLSAERAAVKRELMGSKEKLYDLTLAEVIEAAGGKARLSRMTSDAAYRRLSLAQSKLCSTIKADEIIEVSYQKMSDWCDNNCR